MQKNNIQKCLTLDSDVLLYEDASKGIKKFAWSDFTLAGKSSGGFVYVNNSNSTSLLCNFIKQSYSNKRLFSKLVAFWEHLQKINGGGINDVKLLGDYYKLKKSKIGEITDIINSETYDEGILSAQGCKMEGGIKKIRFESQLPFVFLKDSGKKIRLCCIHCQGPTKFYMKYFAQGKLGLIEKKKVGLMMWFRDNIGARLPRGLIVTIKNNLSKMGF